MSTPKKWYRSRTIRINIIMAVLPVAIETLPILQQLLPANIYAILFFVMVMINVVMRTITTKPVQL